MSLDLTDATVERLLGYLAAGVQQTAAAAACGVTDGYVSQLLDLPDFKSALTMKMVGTLDATIKHDITINNLEQLALEVLEAKLPMVRGAVEAAKIFQIVNNAKRAALVNGGTQRPESLGAEQVAIILPKAASVHIQVNSLNQVVEVNGRSMATLPSRALPALAIVNKEKVTEALVTREAETANAILRNINPLRTMVGNVPKLI